MLTIENSAVDQKVKNIPKENRPQQEMPVAKKGKRNDTATAGETPISPVKQKLLSSIPMAVGKMYI